MTERVSGQSRRTREEIAKWNQMTAPRFQTGGKTSDIPSLPSEGLAWQCSQPTSWPNADHYSYFSWKSNIFH